MTDAKCASEVIFTKDTPYLALTGELCGEDLGENWPRYIGTALYIFMLSEMNSTQGFKTHSVLAFTCAFMTDW